MHTADELTADTFDITIEGTPRRIDQALPGLDRHDRLGLVVDRPLGGFGASTLVLAAITAFYDEHRARPGHPFIYPDHYAFHVGGRHGDHSMLDIWPDQKEVEVPADPEGLLRAINDRAITRLLVPDVAPRPTDDAFERQTLASALDRIVTGVVYSPTGSVDGGTLRIRGDEVTESYVVESVARSDLGPDTEARWRAQRQHVVRDAAPVETFQTVSVEDALARLVGAAAVG